MVAVCLFNNRAWWFYLAVPLWSAYLAWSTFFGIKNGLAGLGGANEGTPVGGAGAGGSSKRQQKLEKRGGQRVQYR